MSNSTYILDDKLIASNGERFINYIIDTIAIVGLTFVFGVFLAVIANIFEFNGMLLWLSQLGTLEERLIFIFLTIVYYIFAESLFGRTFGKLITGTIVVDENGVKPDFGTILKRSLCRIIPFDGISFFGSRGWHDSMSDTYVVNRKALNEDVKSFYEFNLIGVQEIEE